VRLFLLCVISSYAVNSQKVYLGYLNGYMKLALARPKRAQQSNYISKNCINYFS